MSSFFNNNNEKNNNILPIMSFGLLFCLIGIGIGHWIDDDTDNNNYKIILGLLGMVTGMVISGLCVKYKAKQNNAGQHVTDNLQESLVSADSLAQEMRV